MTTKFFNFKHKVSIVLACCVLTSCSVYAQVNQTQDNITTTYNNLKSTEITDEYISKIEGSFFENAGNHNYKKAMELADYLVQINSKLYGENSIQCAQAYLKKGIFFSQLNIFDIAKESIDSASKIAAKHPENTALKNSINNALFLYYFPIGQTYDNIKVLDSVNPELLNTEKEILDIYERLGSVYMEMKEFKKANSYFNKYYKLSKKAYGEPSANSLQYYQDKIFLSKEKLDYDNFYNYYKKAEEIQKQICPDDINQESRNTFALAEYYIDLLDKENAEKIIDSFALKLKDNNNPDLNEEIYGKYFDLNKEINNYEKAKEYLNKLSEFQNNKPENSLKRLRYYEKQIDYYNDTQQYDKAVKAAEKALALIEPVNKYVPAIYGKYLRRAGESISLSGNQEKSFEYYEKAIASYETSFPKDAYPLYEVYKNYAESYQRAGDNNKALDYYLKSLEICRKYMKDEHTDTADIYSSLAFLYSDISKSKEALNYINKAIKIYSRIYGENHIKTYEKQLEKYYICCNLSLQKEADKILNELKSAVESGNITGFKKGFYYNIYIQLAYKNTDCNYESACIYAKKALQYSFCDKQKEEAETIIKEKI